ncbi:multicopper oxidase domain-containing protein [Desulfobacterium sp. N47]|uniref:multicopper oxidase domain-containing protein n=1 Tax=Desulfobacterium sp. N47 TaxID=3115210 RepID=UPI003F4A1131
MLKKYLLTIVQMLAVTAVLFGGVNQGWTAPTTSPGMQPDYYETPNWAYSPALRKFVDGLPKLYATGSVLADADNNLGQYLPVADPDITSYPGSDYYEIELVQYREQMHSDLPPLVLANGSKMDPGTTGGTLMRGYRQTNTADTNLLEPHYLGPIIIATKDRPVRVKFTNALDPNSRLFIPVDTTLMGSGTYEINYNPETNAPITLTSGSFSDNRATLHLHGGRSPWISDGTPHQWITPVGDTSGYPKGSSVAYVPDMWYDASGTKITEATYPGSNCAGQTTCAVAGATNNPGPGSQTFYWTNQQSSRLMFYHDHASGITRLNVYVGEAAGYVVTDSAEATLVGNGAIPPAADTIPLVVQDKTFVDDTTIAATDPTWAWGSEPFTGTAGVDPMTPVKGDFWWPHVYMPAQNPYNPDFSGINAMGRWHYGPWFWPPTPECGSSAQAVPPYCISLGAVPNTYYGGANPNQPPEIPGTPDPSWGAGAFLDTPVINGTAFPTLNVDPKAYRFKVLNASHDRFFNLQLYLAANKADPNTAAEIAAGGTPNFSTSTDATELTEVVMVPASSTTGFPASWPTDGREGGVPSPLYRGPAMIQIGSEGGFLPAPVVLYNHPISYNLDVTMFNVGNVLPLAQGGGTLILGPAERADVIIDFSKYAGKTLILYNDAPTAYPALDPHYDYYTGAPNRTDMGGAPAIPAGVGPNIRTIMQITVNAGADSTALVDDYNTTTLTNLQTAFKATGLGGGNVFAGSQEPVIVGQGEYNLAYNKTFPVTWPYWGVSRISDNSISFMKTDGTYVNNYSMKPKAIHDEMGGTFDEYGRMSAKLGLEVPFSNAAISTFALQNYDDPPTEIVAKDEVQIWKFTHNGVDTHPIHFHLFEVQLINRVGWDGFIRKPDANELGWKETVRMSPLEDTIVALRPVRPRVPFAIPESIRPLNPARPINIGDTEGFSQIDPLTGAALATPTVNVMHNFGHEYVFHCHILSHEENDMMRPLVLNPNAKTEILWRNNGSGLNAVWYMDGVTIKSAVSLDSVPDLTWKIVGVGDFNSDGKPDILWRNTTSGLNVVWYMEGATITSGGNLDSLTDMTWSIVATGDFNSDIYTDILWRNNISGENKVWYMNGYTKIGEESLLAVADNTWKIVGK